MPAYTHTPGDLWKYNRKTETLTAYIHRFKKEAKHCDFNSHPAKIRIFLKGPINIAESHQVYMKKDQPLLRKP